jgi:hypothetical protein
MRARVPSDVAKRGWIARVADDIQRHENTVRAWFYGESAPDLPGFLRLVRYFGPSFGDDVLALAGARVSADTDDLTEIIGTLPDELRRLAADVESAGSGGGDNHHAPASHRSQRVTG